MLHHSRNLSLLVCQSTQKRKSHHDPPLASSFAVTVSAGRTRCHPGIDPDNQAGFHGMVGLSLYNSQLHPTIRVAPPLKYLGTAMHRYLRPDPGRMKGLETGMDRPQRDSWPPKRSREWPGKDFHPMNRPSFGGTAAWGVSCLRRRMGSYQCMRRMSCAQAQGAPSNWWKHCHMAPPQLAQVDELGASKRPVGIARIPYTRRPCPCVHKSDSAVAASSGPPSPRLPASSVVPNRRLQASATSPEH